jgi:hypothetical protein
MSGFRGIARAQRRGAASALAFGAVLLLAGCSWFGGDEKPPLPGDRVSALQLNRQLDVDPELAGTDVILSEPYANAAWAQSGGNQTHAMYHLKASSSALQQVWSVDIGASASDDNRLLAEPVVADGLVYAMDADSVVSAHDAGTRQGNLARRPDPDDEDMTICSAAASPVRNRVSWFRPRSPRSSCSMPRPAK